MRARSRANVWTVDCGATRHCVPSRDLLTHVTSNSSDVRVQVADGNSIRVECVGEVRQAVRVAGGRQDVMVLTGVLVVPGFVCSLFSCAWGFAIDKIRTELNELPQLRLPTGTAVPVKFMRGKYLVDFTPPSGGVVAATVAATDSASKIEHEHE